MYEMSVIGYDLVGWNDVWMVGVYMRRDSLFLVWRWRKSPGQLFNSTNSTQDSSNDEWAVEVIYAEYNDRFQRLSITLAGEQGQRCSMRQDSDR